MTYLLCNAPFHSESDAHSLPAGTGRAHSRLSLDMPPLHSRVQYLNQACPHQRGGNRPPRAHRTPARTTIHRRPDAQIPIAPSH